MNRLYECNECFIFELLKLHLINIQKFSLELNYFCLSKLLIVILLIRGGGGGDITIKIAESYQHAVNSKSNTAQLQHNTTLDCKH